MKQMIRHNRTRSSSAATLGRVGELAAIDRIVRLLPHGADIIVGAGDDCAVVRPERNSPTDWLLTSDAVIEGTHFNSGAPASGIGHKAVGRVLSDLAAMGGEPKWALVDIVAPPRTPLTKLDGVYKGMMKLATEYGLFVVGGDMAQGPVLEIHAFAVGSVPKGKAVLRSGAKTGDVIFVTGALGGSTAGKHLSFMPRVQEGAFLRNWASAMIDISDGLATDLRHIAEMSGVGALLETSRIPVSAAARRTKGRISALDHALTDGEDFELLSTIPCGKERAFVSAWRRVFDLPCTRIGVVTNKKGILACAGANGRAVKLHKSGFEHFRR
jgi:thiamine-monophosphate kinase